MSLVSRTNNGGLNDIFHPAKPTPATTPTESRVQQPSAELAQAFRAAYRVCNNQNGGNIPEAKPEIQAQIKAGLADGSVTAYSIANPDGSPGRTKAYVMTNEAASPTSFFIDAPTWGGARMVGPIDLR